MPLLQHSRIAKTFRQMMRRHQPAAYHVGYAEIASSGCLHWHVIVYGQEGEISGDAIKKCWSEACKANSCEAFRSYCKPPYSLEKVVHYWVKAGNDAKTKKPYPIRLLLPCRGFQARWSCKDFFGQSKIKYIAELHHKYAEMKRNDATIPM